MILPRRASALPRALSVCGATTPASNARTIAAARSRRCSFVKMWPTWLFTVTSLMNSSSAISLFERPRPISWSTSSSRAVS